MLESTNKDFRACPICGKMVQDQVEQHTFFHCRNFLLKKYYKEANPHLRSVFEKKIEQLNKRLSLKGKNLLDT